MGHPGGAWSRRRRGRPGRRALWDVRRARGSFICDHLGQRIHMSPLRMMGIEADNCIDIPPGHEWCGTGDDKELANGLLAFDCANCDAQFCITYSDGKWIASYQYGDNCCSETAPHPTPVQHHAPRSLEGSTPTPTPSVVHCIVLIAVCLVLGAFAVWIVTVGLVLELIAGAIILGTFALGIAAGIRVHKELHIFPTWARVTAAIILGLTISVVTVELTHSHKLIREYDKWGSHDDDQ